MMKNDPKCFIGTLHICPVLLAIVTHFYPLSLESYAQYRGTNVLTQYLMLVDNCSKHYCRSSVPAIAKFSITESSPYSHFTTMIFHTFLNTVSKPESEGFSEFLEDLFGREHFMSLVEE